MDIVRVNHCLLQIFKAIVDVVKAKNSDTICLLIIAMGEFTELQEPLEAGVDIMAGYTY